MKLNPDKFQMGTRVKFGGVTLEGAKQKGDVQKRVYISPAQEKLKEFFYIPTPSCRTDVQCICGMATHLKKWVLGMMFEYPNLTKLTSHHTKFIWSEDLQKELDGLKKAITNHVK